MTRIPQEKLLYYAHDPMCSWCWGFRPVWQQVLAQLPAGIRVQYLLGGLAPDCDEPMSLPMRQRIQATWREIEQVIPGTRFNHDFWHRCQPRRSTYPACRAVLATRMLAPQREEAMLLAIQQAYYLRAMNPSDREVLLQLAAELRLDTEAFIQAMDSSACEQQLQQEIALCRELYLDSFPSLLLADANGMRTISIDYHDARKILARLHACGADGS